MASEGIDEGATQRIQTPRQLGETPQVEDNWAHRSVGMRCHSCMFYVQKDDAGLKAKGRCRRNAPTMNGFPVVFHDDWCGAHKLR